MTKLKEITEYNRKAIVGDLVAYRVGCAETGVSKVSALDYEVDDFYVEDGTYIWTEIGDKYVILEDAGGDSVDGSLEELKALVGGLYTKGSV